MAVKGAASVIPGGRSSDFSGGVWTRSITFLVDVDDNTDMEDTVSGASGLPAYAEAHPVQANCYAKTISYKQVNARAWHVTVGYSDERDLNADPLNDEVLVSWSSEIYQEPIFQDAISGDGLLNSAGDYLIDPVAERDAAHLIAKIECNVASVPSWVLAMQNAVNSGAVTIGGLAIAAGKGKMSRLNIGIREKRDVTVFYPVSFEVHLHLQGWKYEPMDAGFRHLVSGSLENITNAGDSEEVTSPACLDGAGAAQAAPTPSSVVFLSYDKYITADLTTLPGIT